MMMSQLLKADEADFTATVNFAKEGLGEEREKKDSSLLDRLPFSLSAAFVHERALSFVCPTPKLGTLNHKIPAVVVDQAASAPLIDLFVLPAPCSR